MSTAIALRQPTEALAPRTIAELQILGENLSASGFFPDAKSKAQAVAKIMAGAELGFPPIASMNGIHVIEGKLSLGAGLLASAIKRSGKYNYKVIVLSDSECKIRFTEKGELAGETSLTLKEAEARGISMGRNGIKDNWRKNPANMLFARCISNGVRFYCPDLFTGPVYTPEELGAETDGDGELLNAPQVTANSILQADPLPAQTPAPENSKRTADIQRIAELWVNKGGDVVEFENFKKTRIDPRNDNQVYNLRLEWERNYEKWLLEEQAKREAEEQAIDAEPVEETESVTL